MLSVNLIQRHYQAGRLDQLLDALSAGGLDLPLPLRIRLSQHPACALALGLRRLIELTYGPTELSRAMIVDLLALQDPDGSFGSDPLATACAVAALARLEAEHHHLGNLEVGTAGQRALAALAAMQADDGLMAYPADRSWQQRALVNAFILFLLAHDAPFRAAVRLAEMMDWFEQYQDQLEPGTESYWLMARLDAVGTPAPAPTGPAHPALAA
jgi:hypothetical protein